MTRNASRPSPWILVYVVALSAGCAPKQAPQVPQLRVLSEKEADDLWSQTKGYEPAGEPTVRRIPTEDGVRVVCAQTYTLRMAGGSGSVISVCGGACRLTPGSGFPDCKTSGCLSNGRTCSPLVCSGGCTVSEACKAEMTTGFGGFFMASTPAPSEITAGSR